mgnify:CR=1 FL=1
MMTAWQTMNVLWRLKKLFVYSKHWAVMTEHVMISDKQGVTPEFPGFSADCQIPFADPRHSE